MVVKSRILIPMKCCLSVTKVSHNSDYYLKVKIFLINQKSFLKPLICTLGVNHIHVQVRFQEWMHFRLDHRKVVVTTWFPNLMDWKTKVVIGGSCRWHKTMRLTFVLDVVNYNRFILQLFTGLMYFRSKTKFDCTFSQAITSNKTVFEIYKINT